MDPIFIIFLVVVIVSIAAVILGMYLLKVSLKPSRWIAASFLVVNILFYACFAYLSANSWHDPRFNCSNDGMIFILILLIWLPIFVIFPGCIIWWLIREIKEPGNKYVIIKILAPIVFAALCVTAITKDTFWNPNSYHHEMQRKYDARLLDDDDPWIEEFPMSDDDSNVPEDTIRYIDITD